MSRAYTTSIGLSLGGDTPTWEGEAKVSYTLDEVGGVDDLSVTAIDGRAPETDEAETLEGVIWGSTRLLCLLAEDAADDEADAEDRRDEADAERRSADV
jgi:hypothetical protein